MATIADIVVKAQWKTSKIASQTGTFEFIATVTPNKGNNDVVIGFAVNNASSFTDLATIVRFNTSGNIDARNGDHYSSDVVFKYAAKTAYLIRMDVDVVNHVYSVFVSTGGKAEVTLATNYPFRAEQATVAQIQYFAAFSDVGTATMSNMTVATTSPTAPPVITPPVPPVTPPPVVPPVTPPVVPPVTPSGAMPDATNTGPTNKSVLKKMSGTTITTNGYVIQDAAITGTIVIKATGVVIKNFTLDADGSNYGVQVVSGDVTIQDGEITNAMGAAVIGNNWVSQRLNVHDMGSDAFNGGGHNSLLSCYIHHIGSSAGAHADGIQLNNGDNIIIQGNNFDTPWWDQVGSTIYRCNSCCFLNGYVYNYLDGTVIDGNWMNGGNYSVYALGQTNTKITNNVFGTDYQYGRLNGSVSVWSGNTDTSGKNV